MLRFIATIGAYLLTFELPALWWAIRSLPDRTSELAVRNRRQYRYLLARLFDSGLPAAGIHLSRDADRDDIPIGRPLVVIGRHAGLLNFHLLSHIVFEDFHRNPRMVSNMAMLADPGHAVLLRQQGMLYVRRGRAGRTRTLRALAELGAGIKATDAVVIFPEGPTSLRPAAPRASNGWTSANDATKQPAPGPAGTPSRRIWPEYAH